MNSGDMVSKAISVEMARQGISKKQLAREACFPYTTLNLHFKNGKWTLNELDQLASALGLGSAMDIVYDAKREQELSNSRLAA